MGYTVQGEMLRFWLEPSFNSGGEVEFGLLELFMMLYIVTGYNG